MSRVGRVGVLRRARSFGGWGGRGPGEEPQPAQPETPIINRDEEFVAFVIADVHRRAEAEAQFPRGGKAEPEDRP